MDFGLNHLDFMLGVDVMLPDDRRTCALILVEADIRQRAPRSRHMQRGLHPLLPKARLRQIRTAYQAARAAGSYHSRILLCFTGHIGLEMVDSWMVDQGVARCAEFFRRAVAPLD